MIKIIIIMQTLILVILGVYVYHLFYFFGSTCMMEQVGGDIFLEESKNDKWLGILWSLERSVFFASLRKIAWGARFLGQVVRESEQLGGRVKRARVRAKEGKNLCCGGEGSETLEIEHQRLSESHQVQSPYTSSSSIFALFSSISC